MTQLSHEQWKQIIDILTKNLPTENILLCKLYTLSDEKLVQTLIEFHS